MLTPAYAPTATERVLPRLALDFTTGVLDSRVTITRALNTATAVNSSGYIAGVNANLPRFDYDPVTLAPKGLLIEETRANLIDKSQEFNSWTLSEVSVSADTTDTLSPDGTNDADKIIVNNGVTAGNSTFAQRVITKAASPTTYTASVFVKAGGFDLVRIRCRELLNFANEATAIFSLSDGTFNNVSRAGTFTNASATITPYKEGFYRCTLTFTSGSETDIAFRVLPTTGTGDGVKGIYAFGGQFEAGAFATSYIPTTTTSLTRNADVVTMTGTNFSSWYNASTGTLEIEGSVALPASCALGEINDGTNTNVMALWTNAVASAAPRTFIVRSGGSNSVLLNAATVTANTVTKHCVAYKSNDCANSIYGNATVVDTSATIPTVDRFYIGSTLYAALYANGCVRKVNYWPQRLTNAEVQAFSKG